MVRLSVPCACLSENPVKDKALLRGRKEKVGALVAGRQTEWQGALQGIQPARVGPCRASSCVCQQSFEATQPSGSRVPFSPFLSTTEAPLENHLLHSFPCCQ